MLDVLPQQQLALLSCIQRGMMGMSGADLVLAVPGAGFSTRRTGLGARGHAAPVHTLCGAGFGAGWACGASMARFATCMATQQISAALLTTRQVLLAADQGRIPCLQTSSAYIASGQNRMHCMSGDCVTSGGEMTSAAALHASA